MVRQARDVYLPVECHFLEPLSEALTAAQVARTREVDDIRVSENGTSSGRFSYEALGDVVRATKMTSVFEINIYRPLTL